MKKCSKCKIPKEENEFQKDESTRDKLQSQCKERKKGRKHPTNFCDCGNRKDTRAKTCKDCYIITQTTPGTSPRLGMKFPEVWCHNISAGKKGKKQSPQAVENHAAALRGKKRTEEQNYAQSIRLGGTGVPQRQRIDLPSYGQLRVWGNEIKVLDNHECCIGRAK